MPQAAVARRPAGPAGPERHRIPLEKTLFTCRNQSCGTPWELADVVIKDEGQGDLFRCPLCGARNYLYRYEDENGNPVYEQIEGRPF
ncbi:conserved hypothetical protein [Burkholderia gladioli]|jgi:hypothetical protein|uniref:Uncharacterized protein n=1 Tax=Burkholderia gladioli (strain BSR3) TaxID=999541 RepID=F2LK50_BURGS|nr:hypothetical protein bgla_2g01980 [Burkholderia gladioli BSR3]KAF1059209.1 hypothetical protein LvStA_05804 [Burkholderia gladioli]TWC75982.1 hypothetical protein FB600_103205 [Burkholderia sp. SJZ089]TWD06301.1 hypothetical protein FBX98_103205 [Burkholderia sp. SJZ115]TWD10183.1 hypothetical protein FB601_103205 [Burkholderia sp. SJZ091]